MRNIKMKGEYCGVTNSRIQVVVFNYCFNHKYDLSPKRMNSTSIHHQLWVSDAMESTEIDFNLSAVYGCLAMMLAAGLNSLAGLGGGGYHLAILINFFNVLPKNGTIMVFACILGTAFGSMTNQMRKAFDSQPVIKYSYSSITIPVMFIGAIIGVFLNKVLPSIATVSIIIGLAAKNLPKMYQRFKEEYAKQTLDLVEHKANNRESGVIKESKINPFDDAFNIKIFKQFGLMISCYILLSMMKGSQKFESIVGIENCSILYWMIQLGVFGLALYFYKSNLHLQKVWTAPNAILGEELIERDDIIEKNKSLLIKNSIGAGVLSGLGLGGGVLMIPLYRELELTPVQASSTGAFNVFVVAIINVFQALFLGVMNLNQFFFFFLTSSIGSFIISSVIGSRLRKMHRTSYVELMLFCLTILICTYLPYNLWSKTQGNDGDWSIILGFGSFC